MINISRADVDWDLLWKLLVQMTGIDLNIAQDLNVLNVEKIMLHIFMST
jgi:hypothetical protein